MIKDLFDKMDENGDGTVTLWEFSRDPSLGAHYGGMFEVLDANKDGVITMRELIGELYSAASQEELDTMYEWIRPPSISAKTVKKVMLTPDQEQEMTLLFRDYDEDQSGVLSVNELIAALTANQAFSADEVRDVSAMVLAVYCVRMVGTLLPTSVIELRRCSRVYMAHRKFLLEYAFIFIYAANTLTTHIPYLSRSMSFLLSLQYFT